MKEIIAYEMMFDGGCVEPSDIDMLPLQEKYYSQQDILATIHGLELQLEIRIILSWKLLMKKTENCS